MDNDKRIPKLRRQVRVRTINIMAWQENNPSPDKEKAIELKLLQIKLNDALTNYLLHVQTDDWDKHTYVSQPLDESRLQEQQEFLDTNQFVEGSGN